MSTACTSSIRAIISGVRLLEAGMIDAAIVGGADTLAKLPINGFEAQPPLRSRSGDSVNRQTLTTCRLLTQREKEQKLRSAKRFRWQASRLTQLIT